MRHKLSIVVALLLTACAPKFGDSCERSLDCSANGDRVCDLAQPGGYCTIQNCEPGRCGDDGYCVRFRPREPRLMSDWCMARCKKNGDCDRDDYICREADGVNTQIMDKDVTGKFCVVKE